MSVMNRNDREDACGGPVRRRSNAIRWWPAAVIVVGVILAVTIIRLRADLPFQSRNLGSLAAMVIGGAALWLWWLFLSRTGLRWRLLGAIGALLAVGGALALFRIRGVSGDLLPIFEPRWKSAARSRAPTVAVLPTAERTAAASRNPGPSRPDFPQFLGPDRNCVVEAPPLARDWTTHPPQVLWRQPIGPAWSGFAMVGDRAVTQEQRGEEELVTAYEPLSGRKLWEHADPARYATTIAGVGPRATPTVVGNRIYCLGATGRLNCLDLADGRRVWQRDLTAEATVAPPEWGFAGSPLVIGNQVIVSAGGNDERSLLAFDVATGEPRWSAGSAPASYSSPVLVTLADTAQILMFNARRITAHHPETGAVLWEHPWGKGQPQVAIPVPVGPDEVVFSSGYGIGAERLKIRPTPDGKLNPEPIWASKALKAKFANFIAWQDCLFGLDDGILTCVDLADGRRRWKEGRYGHGQLLRVDDLIVLTAERGDLVLLAPTPEAPNELARFPVFDSKTWNPPALSGDLLLLRTDQQAVALRLSLANQGAVGSD